VLSKLHSDAADCLQHAAECEAQAEQTTDPIARASFIDLAARWRRLAESYQYTERISNFLATPKPVGAPRR